MTEVSFPVVDQPMSEDQWQTVALAIGRGIVDRGGNPYWLSNKDSVTNEVTIGVDNIHGFNEAILDGFAHRMDEPIKLTVPPVTTTTSYEIGLVYDPAGHNTTAGPISLQSWVAPGDTNNGVSRLAFWRVTRHANTSLANSPHVEIRPRVSPGIAVTRFSDLPTSGYVLSDMIGLVRSEGAFYRSAVSSGSVQWIKITGGGSGDVEEATHLVEPGKLVRRWDGNGTVHMPDPLAPSDAANKRYVDAKATWNEIANKPSYYPAATHDHTAAVIKSGEFDNARVKGSSKARSNTNVGSTWSSVVATSSGDFGRYPSALKYKTGIREWGLDPETAFGLTPVKYTDKESGLPRVGFVADSYVSNLPELVEFGEDGEVEGWSYMLTCVAQQVAIRDLNERVKAEKAENEILRANQSEILALLGLNTDADGRVITTESGA